MEKTKLVCAFLTFNTLINSGLLEFLNVTSLLQVLILGFSRLQHNVKNGYRMSTAHAYLYPNRFRENLHILTEATVTKVR